MLGLGKSGIDRARRMYRATPESRRRTYLDAATARCVANLPTSEKPRSSSYEVRKTIIASMYMVVSWDNN